MPSPSVILYDLSLGLALQQAVLVSFIWGHNPFRPEGSTPKNAPKMRECRRTAVDKNDYVGLLTPRKRLIFF